MTAATAPSGDAARHVVLPGDDIPALIAGVDPPPPQETAAIAAMLRASAPAAKKGVAA